jgi:hypothetical protein
LPKLNDSESSEERIENLARTIREEPPMSLKKPEFRLLKTELWKLYKNVKDFEAFLTAILDTRDAFLNVRILDDLSKRTKVKKELSMLQASYFLLAFEGAYVSLLDGVCVLLIAKGHDLFDLISRKYVTTPREISDVDISTKFKFLERHGFKMLVRNEDKRLRNRIAHHDFCLNDKEEILIDHKLIDMNSRITDLNNFLLDLDSAMIQVTARRLRENGKTKSRK